MEIEKYLTNDGWIPRLEGVGFTKTVAFDERSMVIRLVPCCDTRVDFWDGDDFLGTVLYHEGWIGAAPPWPELYDMKKLLHAKCPESGQVSYDLGDDRVIITTCGTAHLYCNDGTIHQFSLDFIPERVEQWLLG